jgi:hypothetical protein
MTGSSPLPTRPFRDLQRALVRRRIAAIDFRLRIELALLALLIGVFLFWQARVPLDSIARANGPRGVAVALLGMWALLALAGGSLAGARHLTQLRRGAAGPPWLALPLAPQSLGRHLAWEARAHALWMAIPAPALLLAAVGLVPAWWLALLAAAFVWALLESSRLGCALAWRAALHSAEPRPGLHATVRLLAAAARPVPAPASGRATRWRRRRPGHALWRKDLLLTVRATAARRRVIAPLAFGAVSLLCWALVSPPLAQPIAARLGHPVTPAMAHFFAFALSLVAAATLGEWLIALAGEDPFPVLRGLPVSAATVWASRMAWVILAGLLLVAGHALAARPLSPRALEVFLVWSGGASLVIGLLAVNYGITLFPHEDAAQRMYGLSLGLAVAASLMIPLMGWIVLLAAAIHSARRLPRWSRLEESP